MSDNSKIQWTQMTWNPIVGCSKALYPDPTTGKLKLRQGCASCYAIDAAASPRLQQFQQYKGLTVLQNKRAEWTGKITFVEDKLEEPLHWRKPRMIFVNSMSDMFHDDVEDLFLDMIFATMAVTPRHTYQILTKRPERMLKYMQRFKSQEHAAELLSELVDSHGDPVWGEEMECCVANSISGANGKDGAGWPLKNVWLGVSVEDQETADYAIPLLLQTPAAVRWISAEPLLGEINLDSSLGGTKWLGGQRGCGPGNPHVHDDRCQRGLDWGVVGGESGRRARSMNTEWARKIVNVFAAAGLPLFVKQLGAKPVNHVGLSIGCSDRKGGDPSEWPADLRVRQFPEVKLPVEVGS